MTVGTLIDLLANFDEELPVEIALLEDHVVTARAIPEAVDRPFEQDVTIYATA